MWWVLIGAASATTYTLSDSLKLSEIEPLVVTGDIILIPPDHAFRNQDNWVVFTGVSQLTVESSEATSMANAPPIAFVNCPDLTLSNLKWEGWEVDDMPDGSFPAGTVCPDGDDKSCALLLDNSDTTLLNVEFSDHNDQTLPVGIRDGWATFTGVDFFDNDSAWVLLAENSYASSVYVYLHDVLSEGNAGPIVIDNSGGSPSYAFVDIGPGEFSNTSVTSAPDVFLVGVDEGYVSDVVVRGSSYQGSEWYPGSMEFHSSNISVSGSTWDGTEGYSSGALYAHGTVSDANTLYLFGAEFVDTSAVYNGALHVGGQAVRMYDSLIDGATGDVGAGAIALEGGAQLFTYDTTIVNSQGQDGGGVLAVDSDAWILRSRICAQADEEGGGILLEGGVLDVQNSTVRSARGASIEIGDGTDLTLRHATVESLTGPVIKGSPGAAHLSNTMLVGPVLGVLGTLPSAGSFYSHVLFATDGTTSDWGEDPGPNGFTGEPGFHSGYAPSDCWSDPTLASSSPWVDVGWRDGGNNDDWDGTCPDLGAWGGPAPLDWDGSDPAPSTCTDTPIDTADTGDTADSGDSGDPGDSGDSGTLDDTGIQARPPPILGGGCGGLLGGSAALILGVGALRRRR